MAFAEPFGKRRFLKPGAGEPGRVPNLLTFYVVAQSRGRDLLSDILGKDFGGVLVSDCLAIYDGAARLQQKCYAHHHKAIRKAKDLHPHQGEGFLCEVAAMLRAAVALQQQKADFNLETFSNLRQALEHKASQLLELPRSEPNEEAVRNRLNKQRDHLFTFLDHDGVDATNNLAERQLRPAVIARKISCGNKTQKGARKRPRKKPFLRQVINRPCNWSKHKNRVIGGGGYESSIARLPLGRAVLMAAFVLRHNIRAVILILFSLRAELRTSRWLSVRARTSTAGPFDFRWTRRGASPVGTTIPMACRNSRRPPRPLAPGQRASSSRDFLCRIWYLCWNLTMILS